MASYGFNLPCHFAKLLRGLGIPSGNQNQAPLHGVEHVVLGAESCFFGDHTWMAAGQTKKSSGIKTLRQIEEWFRMMAIIVIDNDYKHAYTIYIYVYIYICIYIYMYIYIADTWYLHTWHVRIFDYDEYWWIIDDIDIIIIIPLSPLPPPPKDSTSLAPVKRKAATPSCTQLASPVKPGTVITDLTNNIYIYECMYRHIYIYIINYN